MPKKVNTLTLKLTYDYNEALKRLSYPATDSNGQVNYSNVNPVKVYYTLPSYVYVHPNDREKMRVGVFEKGAKEDDPGHWQTDCVDEIKYDMEKK